jgi:phenylacetate-CoA ligase
MTQPWPMDLPQSAEQIRSIHAARKKLAVERALRAPFMAPRLTGVDVDRLDDPDEWRKIPPLTKDELRALPSDVFYRDFCIAPPATAVEYWRSGGATGKPLFYPRAQEDMDYMLGVAFRRIWPCIGATAADTVHVSFPMGIHPVGQLTPRSAELEGIGTVWAGAGTTTPSAVQLRLIEALRPTILAAMPSYALHLANVARLEGIDLAAGSVRKLLMSAEPLTRAKRAKLEREWNATVYNSFGMTEGAMTSVERDGVGRDGPGGVVPGGMVAFTDLFYLEVIDPSSGDAVAEGEVGALVMTPLWSNTITPFLRWLTGDMVRLVAQPRTDDPFSVFPVLDHALRTEGFFKVRGVNINHGDLEDFMFDRQEVTDFKAEVAATDGVDRLRLLVELEEGGPSGGGRRAKAEALAAAVRLTFEVTAEIELLAAGTIAKDFENSVKAPRFVDRRNEQGND